MGLLATIAWLVGGLLALLGVYAVAAIVMLFFAEYPESPRGGYLVDVVFVLVYPFVLAVVLLVTVRQRISGNRTL